MNEPSAPYHAHVYYEPRTRAVAERLHQQLDAMRANGVLTDLLFVGEMRDKNVGPHPKPQFEVHFLAAALKGVIPLLSSSGLTILVHPLTQDDVADHTTLAQRTRTNHLTITSIRETWRFSTNWATDCLIHRPSAAEPIRGLAAFKQALGKILHVYSEFSTTIHDLIAEDDRVACRLSQRAVNRGEWTSRLGRHDVAGKPVSWSAIAIFRFREGTIAEEWVSRDELGMLIELGAVAPSRATA